MNKRAILVFGPESSGTRLLTSILMVGGCRGSSDHYQWWDDHPFEEDDDLIVWRRSFPHAGGWPDVARMVGRLREDGYAIQAVVMVREHHSLVRSQLARNHVHYVSEAEAHISEAYGRIISRLAIHHIPYIVVTFEGLVARPEAVQRWLQWELKLPKTPHVEVTDENEKYYREGE